MVFTFGWTGDFVVRCIVRMGVRQGDKFLVLRVRPRDELAEKRFQEAYRYVVEFLEKLGVDYVIEYADVGLEGDLRGAVARIARLVASEASRGVEEVYVFLVGGPRPLVVAALLASRLLTPMLGVPVKLYTAMEDSPELIEVWSGLLSAPNSVGEAQIEVLRALAEKPKTVQELSSELGRSVETVKKVLKKLYRRGLVGRRREGRRSVYTLTDLGSLFLGVAEALRGGGFGSEHRS